jgi:hypothetical protein
MKILDWILGLFSKPQEEITVWPFPAEPKIEVTPVKKKPTVKKATTRTVAKKTVVVAKKATKKKAK